MQVNVEKLEKNVVVMEVEVEEVKLTQACDKAYAKIAKKVNIPGFRKGKTPRAVLERHIGKEAVYDEALEILLPEVYVQALDEAKIEPIDRPQVEVTQLEAGKPLIFKATVEVKPEVKLGQYIGLEVVKEENEVTEEQVNEELKKLQQRHAKLITLEEGTVEQGDTVTLDFEGFIDDVPFPGGKGEEHPLEIGSGTFIPGFEDQLVGMAIGENKDVKVTFPEDYQAAELAGKEAIFKSTIKGIKRKEFTSIDDEFAKDVSEFGTLDELKTDILNRLNQAAELKSNQEFRKGVIEASLANAEVEIPEVMVSSRVETMINNMAQRFQSQGFSLENYLQYTNSTIEQLKENFRPEAERDVKVNLVLEAIAKAENLQVSDEDLDKEINKMAEQYKQEPAQLRTLIESQGNINFLRDEIGKDKTIDFLVEKVAIK